MASTADLERIHELMAQHYRFEAANFPAVEGMSDVQVFQFSVRHLGLHFAKELGQLVALVEPADHGAAIDNEALKRQVPKMFATLMKLTQVIGVTPDEMVTATRQKYESMGKAA